MWSILVALPSNRLSGKNFGQQRKYRFEVLGISIPKVMKSTLERHFCSTVADLLFFALSHAREKMVLSSFDVSNFICRLCSYFIYDLSMIMAGQNVYILF